MISLLLGFALLFSPAHAFDLGGIDRGNGTDIMEKEDTAAWFTGAKNTVKYCIRIQPMFTISEADLDRDIQFAFQTWNDYDANKGVDAEISFKGQKVDRCRDADLTFQFVPTIPSTPTRVAFAQRKDYDAEKGWGKGVIWVAEHAFNKQKSFPDLAHGTGLKAILIHELGHAFGVPHIDGTIMSAGLATTLLSPGHESLSIDGDRQLVRGIAPSEGVLALPAEPAHPPFFACRDETAELFQVLTGRPPVGKVRALFKGLIPTSLTVVDDLEAIPFTISFEWGGAESVSTFSADIFYVAKAVDGVLRGQSYARHISGVRYGQLKTKTRETLNILWEQNMNSEIKRGGRRYNVTGDVLKWFSPQGPRLLFASSYRVTGPTPHPKRGEPEPGTCLR